MKSRILWLLLGLNVGLGLMLVMGAVRDNTAMGQARIVRPNDYLLIPGDVSGTDSGVVYIVDTSSGSLGAVTYEDSNRRIVSMPSIDLNRVFSGQNGVR